MFKHASWLREHRLLILSLIFFLLAFALFITLITLNHVRGATIQSIQSGDWNDAATWKGGVCPTALDNAQILDGDTVTQQTDNSSASVTVNHGATFNLNGHKMTCSGEFQLNATSVLVENGEIEANLFNCDIAVTVGSGETLILENCTSADLASTLTINSGGVFEAPSTTLTLSKGSGTIFTNNNGASGYVHNSGTFTPVVTSECKFYPGGAVFYNIGQSGGNYAIFYNAFTVENQLDIRILRIGADVAVTFGTISFSGSFVGDYWQTIDNGYTVQAVNESYPAVIKPEVDYHFGAIGSGNTIKFRWVDLQSNEGTAGNGNTIQLLSDCEFDAFTVASGDTLNLNGYKLTSSATVTLNSGSTLVENGEIEANLFDCNIAITVGSGETLILENCTSADLASTLTINSGGVLEAPSGTMVMRSHFNNDGLFIHNNGVVYHQGGTSRYINNVGSVEPVFYKLYIGTSTTLILKDSITVENLLDITHSAAGMYPDTSLTVSLGTISHAGTIDNGGHIKHLSSWKTVKFKAANPTYPCVCVGNDWGWSYLAGSTYELQDIDYQIGLNSANGGANSVTIKLTGDCEFDALTISSGDTLNLNGHANTIDGIFTTSGTLTTGTTSEIHLGASASWAMNQNITVKEFEVDCDLSITGDRNITFTNDEAFQNSTGHINITGTASTLVHLYGASSWNVNSSNIGNGGHNWRWLYVNITNGNNIDTVKRLTVLGENNSCQGLWDFQAPGIVDCAILNNSIVDIRTDYNLNISWEVGDLSYLHTVNFTITRIDNGQVLYTNNRDHDDFGEVTNVTLSGTVGIDRALWAPDEQYRLTWDMYDAHNKPSDKIKKKADNLAVTIGGEWIGGKTFKKKSPWIDTTHFVLFDYGKLEPIYQIDFLDLDNDKCKHRIRFTDDLNFKFYHRFKPIKTKAKDIEVIGVRMKISARSLEYMEESSHAGHFIINREYFYEMQDFIDMGGQYVIDEVGVASGLEYYILTLTHPDWEGGKWCDTIDPLSGAINSNVVYYDFTLTYTWNEEPIPVRNVTYDSSFCFFITVLLVVVAMVVIYNEKQSIK